MAPSLTLTFSQEHQEEGQRPWACKYIEDGDGTLNDFIKLIWSTALVPLAHLLWYWENIVLTAKPEINDKNLHPDELQHIKKDYEERVDQLLQYLEKTYIGFFNRNRIWKEPRFKSL